MVEVQTDQGWRSRGGCRAAIQASFEPYCTEARVEASSDPNILHQIGAKLAQADIYTSDDVENFARAWFNRAGHSTPGSFHGVGDVLGSSRL